MFFNRNKKITQFPEDLSGTPNMAAVSLLWDTSMAAVTSVATKTPNQLKPPKTTQNYPKPPTKPTKTTNKTNQNDPKPAKIHPNTTGLRDICVDVRLWCCVTVTLTIMHGIFTPLSCSLHWKSHEKSKRVLSLETDQLAGPTIRRQSCIKRIWQIFSVRCRQLTESNTP